MTGAGKKKKGSDYEREIAKKYIEYDIDKHATRMPLSGADAYLKGDIRHSHNVAIPFKFIDEVKRQENINWYEWWKQTLNQCGQGEEPVLHFKKSNCDGLTVLRTNTYFSLLGEIVRLYNQKELRGEIIVDDSKDNKKTIWVLKQVKELIGKAIRLLEKEI